MSKYGVYWTCHSCSKGFKYTSMFPSKCTQCGAMDGYEFGEVEGSGLTGIFCKVCNRGSAEPVKCPKCGANNAITHRNFRIKRPTTLDDVQELFVAGFVVVVAILFIVVLIASSFDDGINFDNAKPDKMILMPTKKGYRPAPVFDLNN